MEWGKARLKEEFKSLYVGPSFQVLTRQFTYRNEHILQRDMICFLGTDNKHGRPNSSPNHFCMSGFQASLQLIQLPAL